ncbi:MAG TPA: hypothetical protein VHV56_02295 [Pseudolabrys sp.]|jgi:hypothetical protein|nr:hypothetical protein [Pseudolabrys sp.]
MSERRPGNPLSPAILAATIICPRIVYAVVRAGHGERGDELRQLRAALTHARELLTRLEMIELQLAAAARIVPPGCVALDRVSPVEG